MLSIIQAAGWPIWPLILCSIAALTIIIERLFSLRASLIAPASLLDEVLGVFRRHGFEQAAVIGSVAAASAEPRLTVNG